ncbi:unnamed protein product [Arabis nemorensis]|uniref:Uncharacterized protein n=1 Tax=Arabis nemorensis TaxID=586526 RepID=A0A565C4W7_9BRAS|nr:unnamed protein product [Arabis nemorensis]
MVRERVMPISSFVHHYKVMLNELLSQMKKDDTDFSASNCLHPSSMRKKYGHTDTKSFRGEDIGVIVLGKFKDGIYCYSTSWLFLHVSPRYLKAYMSTISCHQINFFEGSSKLLRCQCHHVTLIGYDDMFLLLYRSHLLDDCNCMTELAALMF